MKRNTILMFLVLAFAAVVAGCSNATASEATTPATVLDYPVYTDAMDVNVGGVSTYYSGELLYMEWHDTTPVGNSAGFSAYSVVPSLSNVKMKAPKVSIKPQPSSTQWLTLEIYIRDPLTNDIIDTINLSNCVFVGLDYIGGNSHTYFDCPAQ